MNKNYLKIFNNTLKMILVVNKQIVIRNVVQKK